ncbi:protein spire homolog 1-like [Daphnia carinata]|uniref:protein spire homolog 1-like n=1 Tax=Daphnia carinata TaxID=120202 RepID=UPI00257F09D5|nr:protein spire homolog 1-like [Daphnia carinata]
MAAARWTSPSLTSGKSEKFEHTKLDETTESLSLLSILRAFDSPVTEERAWAILYQSAKTALQCFTSANAAASSSHHNNTTTTNSTTNIHNLTDNSDQVKCAVVGETSQLWIHRDGHVHPHSFQVAADSIEAERRTVAECQSQLVSGLGWALFEALDYGCKREEQNVLSPDLEQMIDFLTSADTGECQSAEDEGIEQDSGEVEESAATANVSVETTSNASTSSSAAAAAAAATMTSLSHVMDRCRMQISSTASSVQADAHFKAVCRALVAETLEFSDFLVKVSSAPEDWRELRNNKSETHSQELTELHLADWAKLWVQVIRQLRNGVKLKASGVGESARKPIEYELTPYEMMMDDIRSRRYKLRQVMVDGTIPPRVKKDAHAVILEFIRSRPPLRKASERKLRPLARRVSTPVELLMESIRQHDSKELRPTRCLLVNRTENVTATISTTTKRKLLKADHLHDELEEDEDLELPPPSPPRRYDYMVDPFASCSRSESSTPLNSKTDARIHLHRERDESPSRRHSLTVLPPPLTRTASNPFLKRQSMNAHLNSHVRQGADPRMTLNPANLSSDQPGSLPCSGPSSSTSSSSASLHSPPGSPTSAGHLQEDFVRSKEFQQVVQGKLVTLEELVHMRRVLTAASLDNLPLDSSIKDDVVNGKVCFVCRKTRFSVFGSWWHNCKLCRRTVCTKCCMKMRIPSDQFDTVDVSQVSWYGANAADKLEQSSPVVVSSSSLFSSFQLKLPQFRIRSPNGGTTTTTTDGCESSESTPTSPVLNRRGSERRKQTLAQPPQKFLHQALSRHQSLSTNNTPARKPVSAQASVCTSHQPANKRSSSSGSDCYVCRDCQTLIENIIYNPVHTVTHCERPSIHVSLP